MGVPCLGLARRGYPIVPLSRVPHSDLGRVSPWEGTWDQWKYYGMEIRTHLLTDSHLCKYKLPILRVNKKPLYSLRFVDQWLETYLRRCEVSYQERDGPGSPAVEDTAECCRVFPLCRIHYCLLPSRVRSRSLSKFSNVVNLIFYLVSSISYTRQTNRKSTDSRLNIWQIISLKLHENEKYDVANTCNDVMKK